MTLTYTLESRIFEKEHYDSCTVCGRNFIDGNTTHLGYNHDNNLELVGDCCISVLKETIVRHVYQTLPYIIPNPESVLWRFMDLAKFVSLMQNNSLYFSRADCFEDPFEGAKGVLIRQEEWSKSYYDFFCYAIDSAKQIDGISRSLEEIKEQAQRLLLEFKESTSKQPLHTFINCWHENQYESEAMWKLYTKDSSQGIAIRTTYNRLYNSMQKNPSISIGRVNYIDYSKRFVDHNGAFWYKRCSFEHEKEVRAILSDYTQKDVFGILIPVDLNILIDHIYVSPTAPSWFYSLVRNLLDKYTIHKEVADSTLNIKPFC